MCASATKMLPSGATSTSFGSVNFAGGSPASPGVPSVISSLPCGLNFSTVWPLPFASGNFFSSAAVAERASATHTLPCSIDVHAVRPEDLSRAEALHDLAARIELDDRIDLRAGADIGAAAIAGPDVLAVDVDVDRADRSPSPSVGQRAPVAHRLVRIRQVVDRRDLGVLGRTRRATRRCGRRLRRGGRLVIPPWLVFEFASGGGCQQHGDGKHRQSKSTQTAARGDHRSLLGWRPMIYRGHKQTCRW